MKAQKKKFKVSATVLVPIGGYIVVEAKNAAEAQRIAMETLEFKSDDPITHLDDEWQSHLWQNGTFDDIRWTEAQDLTIDLAEALTPKELGSIELARNYLKK